MGSRQPRSSSCSRSVVGRMAAFTWEGTMKAAFRVLLSAIALAFNPFGTAVILAQVSHPTQISVNGRIYDWPTQPLVVVLIDGGTPNTSKRASKVTCCRT